MKHKLFTLFCLFLCSISGYPLFGQAQYELNTGWKCLPELEYTPAESGAMPLVTVEGWNVARQTVPVE